MTTRSVEPVGVSKERLKLEGISKRFHSVMANDDISLSARAGEIHAIVGENGAGKTTLMNIIYGIYQGDSGKLYVSGQPCVIKSPLDAIRLGISLVSQHFLLVEHHTVTENLALALPDSGWLFSRRRIATEMARITKEYGLALDLDATVSDLAPGVRQRLEIIKALMRRSKILVLDEPTSVLTPQEAEKLFQVLRRLREEGCAILFISHKLDEVLALSDRISVLRKGKLVSTFERAGASKAEISRAMMGREIPFFPAKSTPPENAPRLRVDGLQLAAGSKPISFKIGRGEILGIAGIAGNGQKELAHALTGLQPVGTARITLDEDDLEGRDATGFRQKGVAHIPEDRNHMGVVPSMTVEDNVLLCQVRRHAFRKGPFLAWREIGRVTDGLISEYQIATPSRYTRTSLLSGGNVQKLVLARELLDQPRLIVAVHPTYGLDIQATMQVHQYFQEQSQKGAAILLISEDLEEVLSLSHRVGVLFQNRLIAVVRREEARIEQLGLWMAGEAA
jgi:simple sugar transport system ATP-binding protein